VTHESFVHDSFIFDAGYMQNLISRHGESPEDDRYSARVLAQLRESQSYESVHLITRRLLQPIYFHHRAHQFEKLCPDFHQRDDTTYWIRLSPPTQHLMNGRKYNRQLQPSHAGCFFHDFLLWGSFTYGAKQPHIILKSYSSPHASPNVAV